MMRGMVGTEAGFLGFYSRVFLMSRVCMCVCVCE